MRKLLVLSVLLIGCGSDASSMQALVAEHDAGVEAAIDAPKESTTRVCAPGKQEACACVGGEQGAQRCDSDGMAWGECKCPHVDSGAQDVAVDTHELVDDSAVDVVVDVAEDTEMDSGADVGTPDAVVAICQNPRLTVVDPGELTDDVSFTGKCKIKRNGLVHDTQTGLHWQRYPMDGCTGNGCYSRTYPEAVDYCQAMGMRLPKDIEIYTFVKQPLDECVFPCGFASWISDPTCKYGQHSVEGYGGVFCSDDTTPHFTMCVKP